MFQPKPKATSKMRKTMSGLIMLTLLSSLIIPGVAGAESADPPYIEFVNKSVQAGQTVEVPVVLNVSELPIQAYNMQIDYDTTAF